MTDRTEIERGNMEAERLDEMTITKKIERETERTSSLRLNTFYSAPLCYACTEKM